MYRMSQKVSFYVNVGAYFLAHPVDNFIHDRRRSASSFSHFSTGWVGLGQRKWKRGYSNTFPSIFVFFCYVIFIPYLYSESVPLDNS